MPKLVLTVAFILGTAIPAFAQQAQQQAPAQSCVVQYDSGSDKTSPAGLLSNGFSIVAAVPGGVWMQKGAEAYYCTVNRTQPGEPICWKLRDPVTVQNCQ